MPKTHAAPIALALAAACLLAPMPAAARVLVYSAELSGANASTDTGSSATGQARISVDTRKQTVSLDLEIEGLRLDELWDTLVAAPIGPIHFHRYASHDHTNPDASVLVLPIPFGPNYSATKSGFAVHSKNYSYASGAAVLNSDASFKAFVEALNSGAVVLNVHTDAFEAGEISGPIASGPG